jgi:putative toxin-antitoxin system antitoxin component (TIGR02293 family)
MQKVKTLELNTLDYNDSESCRAFRYFIPEKLATRWNCSDQFDVISSIRGGLPHEAVNEVLEKTSVSRQQLSQILHISTRQLNRYENDDKLPAEQSGFLYEFSRLYIRGLDIFGDKDTLEKWLNRKQMALGGTVPLTLLDTAEGFRMINDLLSQIEYGFYS